MEALTVETFTPHVDSTFRAETGAGDFDLLLEEAVAGGIEGRPAGSRPTFSLTFRGPAEPILRQSIYRLHHPALGELDIFIVPIGADARGVAYQAVFA